MAFSLVEMMTIPKTIKLRPCSSRFSVEMQLLITMVYAHLLHLALTYYRFRIIIRLSILILNLAATTVSKHQNALQETQMVLTSPRSSYQWLEWPPSKLIIVFHVTIFLSIMTNNLAMVIGSICPRYQGGTT